MSADASGMGKLLIALALVLSTGSNAIAFDETTTSIQPVVTCFGPNGKVISCPKALNGDNGSGHQAPATPPVRIEAPPPPPPPPSWFVCAFPFDDAIVVGPLPFRSPRCQIRRR
jgi:hypothetical protein